MDFKALLNDAITVLNAHQQANEGDALAQAWLESDRLQKALGIDCHGELYTPDMLGLESDYEKLTDLAMEVLPERIVKETKDIEELVRAAANEINHLETQLHIAQAGAKFLASDEDRTDEHSQAIDAAHPTQTEKYGRYFRALQMVGARHSKYALVDLVNWLLTRIEEKP